MLTDKKNETVKDNAILVTGGSGFIGRNIVKNLADEDKTVVCMYHHRLPEPRAHVYPVCSDMGSSELIAAPLRGVQTVVHLAWEGGFVGPTEKVSWNLKSEKLPKNIRLLRNLIAAMEDAGTPRIVFLSSIGSSRNAETPFLQEKYLAEFFILNSKIPERVIIRSSVVCGGDYVKDKFLKSILRVMQFPGVYPVPKSQEKIAPLHIKDLTKIICDAAVAKMDRRVAVLEINGQKQYAIEELFKLVSNRYVKGSKLQLKGILGNTLLPLFERSKETGAAETKLKYFLSIGNSVNETTNDHSPLIPFLPLNFHSFEDVLAENQSL